MISIIVGIILVLGLCVYIYIDNKSRTIEFTVETNGGVPYEWEYEIEDQSIVKYVETKEIENKNDGSLVGGLIKYNFVFKGIKKGTTKITLKYVSVVTGEIDKKEEYKVKVDTFKNISLLAN